MMEAEFSELPLSSDDLYDREEKCIKAIRVVRKALLMRLVMAVLMVGMVVLQPTQPIVWGIAVFVVLLIGIGSWPLAMEWKKQKNLLRELIAQEEE